MVEYGFEEGRDFCSKMSETSSKGGRPSKDAEISVDMAKQICMIRKASNYCKILRRSGGVLCREEVRKDDSNFGNLFLDYRYYVCLGNEKIRTRQ